MAVIGRGAALLFFVCCQLVGLSALPARAAAIDCGAVLTESVALTADIVECPGDALVIGADNITIDLGGHYVGTADTGAAGVRVEGHHGVTVRHGSIRGGDYGVLLSRGANDNTVEGISVTGRLASIAILNSNRNTIYNSYSYSAPGHGILLMHANRNVLERNRMAKENDDGNGRGGISLLSNSDRNRVIANQASQNSDGIYVASRSDHNLIARNTATYNFDDGIDIDDPKNTVRRNVTNNNFDGFGIEAVPGTQDGGGNTASGNGWSDGDPTGMQCLNIACS